MRKKWISRIGAVLLAAAVAVTTAAPAFAVEGEAREGELTEISVSLSRPDATMEVDEELTLSANVGRTPADAKEEISISWSLDEGKENVLSVEEKGQAEDGSYQAKVKALEAGTATVTVTATAKVGEETLEAKAYCEVTVRGVGLSGPGLTDGKLTLLKGQSQTLTATPYGSIGSVSQAKWISDSPSIAFVTSGGTVTGQNVGETKIMVEIGNYSAECTVVVLEDTSSVIDAGDLGDRASFKISELTSKLQAMCTEKLGADQTLSYLMGLSVPTKQGTLFYRYSSTENTGNGVGSTEKYYLSPSPGQLDFNEVSFVPNPEYTGRVEIQFFAYSATNNFFSGTIHLQVEGVADVSYSGVAGSPVAFQAADFAAVYKRVTGSSLRYLTFELPSIVQGTLYYDYLPTNLYNQPVKSGTSYYRDRSPQIDLISFVPAQGSSGQVKIKYFAYGAEGSAPYAGTILISVAASGEDEVVSLGTISYTAGESGATFRGEDFNSVCKKLTGMSLNYLQFTPPSSGGTLYYDYKGTKESVVTADKAYYMTTSPLISDLTFLPDTDTKGTVNIPFTGVSTGGDLVKGTVAIQANVPTTSAIRYSGNALPVVFARSSFEQACKTLLKTDLSYIQFSKLPDASYGTLYENYENPNAKGSLVTEDTQCFLKTGDDFKKLTFVPRAGFQGRTTLMYTGYDTNNDSFTGSVEIYIADNYTAAHFTDMRNWKWAQPAVEFLYAMDVVSGVSATRFGPDQRMQRGDFTLMLCKAFGFDTGNTASFPDVSPDSYYAWAVATAKDLGIVVGDETGKFRPTSGLLRQDAMVMLQKAMKVAGMDVPDGSYASLIGFVDRESVSPYARNAMGAMVEMGIIIGDDHKRLNPQKNLNRAEMATILHHILTL